MSQVRRSSRANKGRNERLEQAKKEEEELYQKQLRDAEGKEEDRIKIVKDSVLCLVCGTNDENYEEEADDKEMIQCDSCGTWQHSLCVLGDTKKIPESYKCYICEPDSYKDYAFEVDPAPYVAKWRRLNKKKTTKKKAEGIKSANANDDDDDEYKNNPDQEQNDHEFSEDEQVAEDDEEYNSKESKSSRTASKRRNTSVTSGPEKRKKSTPPAPTRTKTISDDIEVKAREAVTKRFEGMFIELLAGHRIPNETESAEVIANKWAKKLEEDLFEVYHDRETGKTTKDYKEGSTRIFVNVRDVKNKRLRNSIINKSVPFIKLVKMPVNELLNPDLKKEKEEAIKESMTQATFETASVSNIRRTHKGDIVIEKESTSDTPFDFNVGVSIDNDEKKFIKSESHVNNERKNSLYNSSIGNNDDYDDDENANQSFNDNNDNDEHEVATYNPLIDELKEDDDLAKILGETKKKIESNVAAKKQEEAYDPTSNVKKPERLIWEGQTIFTGVTNFESKTKLVGTTLNEYQFNRCAPWLIDSHLPLMIEGRLDFKTADSYILKAAGTRKLVLLELEDKENAKNFFKLFDYFEKKHKFGVIPLKKSFIKDCYLLPVQSSVPKFFSKIPNLPAINKKDAKLYIVFIIKQELISSLDEVQGYSAPQPVPEQQSVSSLTPDFNFLSNLSPGELALVTKIFDDNPQAKQDPALLIEYLQNELLKQQQQQQQQQHPQHL